MRRTMDGRQLARRSLGVGGKAEDRKQITPSQPSPLEGEGEGGGSNQIFDLFLKSAIGNRQLEIGN